MGPGGAYDASQMEAARQARLAATQRAGGPSPGGASPADITGAGPGLLGVAQGLQAQQGGVPQARALQPWQRAGLRQAAAGGGMEDYLSAHPGVAEHMQRVAAGGATTPGMERFGQNMLAARTQQGMAAEAGRQMQPAAPPSGAVTGDNAQDQARLAAQNAAQRQLGAAGAPGSPWAGATMLPPRTQGPMSMQGVRPMPRGGFGPRPAPPGRAPAAAAGPPGQARPAPRAQAPARQAPARPAPRRPAARGRR